MNAPTPTATGTLQKTPVLNLLVYGLERALDGTLVVEHAGERSAVRFTRGTPTKVRLSRPSDLIGEVLVEVAGLGPGVRDRIVARATQEGQLTGYVAVSEGEVSAEDVQEALALQVYRRLTVLSALPGEAVYGYYAGQDFLGGHGGPRGAESVDVLAAIWHVARTHPSDEQVDAVVARFAGRPLRLHRQSRPARFGFSPSEGAVIDLLRVKPYDLDALIGTGLLPATEMRRLLYALALTRHLDLGAGTQPLGVDAAPTSEVEPVRPKTAPRPPTGQAAVRRAGPRAPGQSPSPPPATAVEGADALTPEQIAYRDELLRRAETIGGQNYYEILGVDPKAEGGAIRSAFFQLAKQWHPDRVPKALAEHKDVAAKLFSRMTEAHQVLSNEDQRREYDELMKDGGASAEEQEQVQRILKAATAYQKAEFFARKNNWAEAAREVKFACENDPEQPEYQAFYADVLSREPERTRFDDVVRMVNEAKKAQENNLKVRLYRARVMQRAGNPRAAFNEFQHIAEADPRNVEAAREVRLFRMRQGQGVDEKKGGIGNQDIGELFGKFFKR